MKRVFKGLMLCSAIIGLASCSNEEGFRNGGEEGRLLLELSSDGRVMMNTRADDTRVSVVPEPSQFGVVLEKQDGSLTKKYANIDLFNRETGFPIGTYTLSANYGDMENEGFELPYFTASEEVTVYAGAQSSVHLTATLANAMVSVRYSDEFASRFPAYSARIKSDTSDDSHWVAFAQNEDRPAYVKPEVINLRVSLTNDQGKQVEVAPGDFTAQPRHHYIVTIGVSESGGAEDVKLNVEISEEIEHEFVDISLGDDLFNAPAPMLKLYDFPADLSYNEFEGFTAPGDPRLDVLAYGGLREVNLSVESSNSLAFGNTVQLVNADASVQANVAASGLVAEGFFRNPDKAGVIKFKDFLSKLPQGTYKVTVDAIDNRTIVSEEPVSFNVTIKGVTIQLAMAQHPEFMGEEMAVNVITNQPDVQKNIHFQVKNAGQWVDAEIMGEPTPVRATRASDDEYTFTYRLSVPAIELNTIDIRAFYGSDSAPKCELNDDGVIFPEYTVEVDPYSYKALLKVTAMDPSKQDIVYNKFKLNNTNFTLKEVNKADGIYELSGLNPQSTYTDFKSHLGNTNNPGQVIESFTTESARTLPNGDFGEVSETINFSNIQVGGQWKVSPATYTTTSSIVRSTPNGWASLNDLTCWGNSKARNTWFMVPSTYSDNGRVVIRSVGYNHDGKVPATSGGAFNTTYYCENLPSEADFQKSHGELFLGTYVFDGNEHRADGIDWNCRPSSVTFDYEFSPVNGEEGEAYVRILDESGNVLSSGIFTITSSERGKGEILLEEYPFGKLASKIELCFRSTKRGISPQIVIPGKDVVKHDADGISNLLNSSQRVKEANNYYAFAIGSELIIDNVKLEYGGGSSSQQAKRRNAAKKNVARKNN